MEQGACSAPRDVRHLCQALFFTRGSCAVLHTLRRERRTEPPLVQALSVQGELVEN